MATKELLGTNRGFELGDVTQFSTTGSANLVSFAANTGATVAYAGTYGGLGRNAATDVDWGEASVQMKLIITTDTVYCAPGIPVTASFWHRIYQDTLPDGGRWGTRTMAMTLDFYTSGDVLISSESVNTTFPNATFAQATGTAVTAPATTNKVCIKVVYTIPCDAAEGYEDLTINHYISVDDFSITVPGAVARGLIIA